MPKPKHGGKWNRTRQAWEFTCERCGFKFWKKIVRRPPRYCQSACRQGGYRSRNGGTQVGPTLLK
jgi:hypothetical protein